MLFHLQIAGRLCCYKGRKNMWKVTEKSQLLGLVWTPKYTNESPPWNILWRHELTLQESADLVWETRIASYLLKFSLLQELRIDSLRFLSALEEPAGFCCSKTKSKFILNKSLKYPQFDENMEKNTFTLLLFSSRIASVSVVLRHVCVWRLNTSTLLI